MKLKIYDTKTIGELEDKFIECFPGFRIKFFKNHNALKGNLPVGNLLTIADISKKHIISEVEIKTNFTAQRIIHDFKSKLGLLVQIYKMENDKMILLPNDETLAKSKSSRIKPPWTDDSLTKNEEEIRLSL